MIEESLVEELESESIEIIREVVATAAKPVMLYSIGKDSSVMLRLAQKAFFPGPIPFPLMHIDTGWKFREMIAFRNRMATEVGFELITYTNPRGLAEGIGPVSHGSAYHTDVMKTEALRQALDLYGFDAAFGGARRDEEKSRAKERIFSFRAPGHRWEPKAQRPELWNLYNTRINPGETIRVFPLSNWTEADSNRAQEIWSQYEQQHDLSERLGQTAGIDPTSRSIWFGESIQNVIAQRDADGSEAPLFFVRVGSSTYYRKGGRS